jgi:DNA-binding transcriptional LysR family regulator
MNIYHSSMHDPSDAPLDWNLVQVFLALCEAGSLGRAAARLGLSQPTLSRRLADLEARLGQALFERSALGLRLTEAGKGLQAPALAMREQAERLLLGVQRHARSVAGSVRLTASEAVCAFVLLPLLREFRKQHPMIQIDLLPSDGVEDLLARDADIAVRMLRPTQASLIARRMADMPLGFFAHRSYLARRGMPAEDSLAAHDWIGQDRQTAILEGFRASGRAVTREFFSLRCDNSATSWQAVCAGLGIGVGLEAVAAQTPGVVRVLPEVAIPPLPVWLVVHRELRGTPRLKLLFDSLAQSLSAR